MTEVTYIRNGKTVSYLNITNQDVIDSINAKAGCVLNSVGTYCHEQTDGVHSCWDTFQEVRQAALAPVVQGTYNGTVLSPDDYGPQRWNYEGVKLEQTSESGVWTDGDMIYHESYGSYPNEVAADEIVASCWNQDDPNSPCELPKKVRTELNDFESKWLHDHEELLESLNDEHDTWECNDIVSETGEELVSNTQSLDDAQHSTDATEINKEAYKIFGTNKGHDSAIWVAVRFSKNAAIKMIQRAKEHLSEDELDYLRYIVLAEDITLPSHIRTILPQHNSYKTLTCWIKTITTGTKYMPNGRKVGFTPYPGMFVKARREIESLYAETKSIHIDYYKPTESCKEGFANIWTTVNDKVTGVAQITFFTREKAVEQVQKIMDRGATQGYINIIRRDMNALCIREEGKTPLYKTARTLWNTPSSYIEATPAVLVR